MKIQSQITDVARVKFTSGRAALMWLKGMGNVVIRCRIFSPDVTYYHDNNGR